LLELLGRLGSNYGGAVALISGRSMDQLDRIFGHYKPAAAASHGLEQRLPDGQVVYRTSEITPDSVSRVVAFAERNPGVIGEQKPFSVGVHYRARPELESVVLEAMAKINAELDMESLL